MAKKTIADFLEMKKRGERIAATVNYTKTEAISAEKAGMDWILAPGDSGGPNLLEYNDTVPVTMDEMIMLAKAVRKGAPDTLRVGDMPFGSYFTPIDAVANAGRFYKEAGVQMVKLEGGRNVTEQIRAIVKNGMKVMGHIGLTPQTAGFSEGYVVHGSTAESAREIILDAIALKEAGVSAVLLEAVPAEVGQIIAQEILKDIPVFGIGAGPFTNGELLLDVDILGKSKGFNPLFAKCFVPQAISLINEENILRRGNKEKEIPLNLANITFYSFKEYIREVKAGIFPGKEHCYRMEPPEYEKLIDMLGLNKGGQIPLARQTFSASIDD